MKLWRRIKSAVKQWLEKLAEDNRKEFGNSPPSCCAPKREHSTKQAHPPGDCGYGDQWGATT